MATKSKNRPPGKRPMRYPQQRPASGPPWYRYGVAGGLLALAVLLGLIVLNRGGSSAKTSVGLPHTPDYHSLLVNASDSRKLVLGTHAGLYVSSDGGRHWRRGSLSGDDAMNLARAAGATIWLAGHDVFKRSIDGGTTWADVHPSGLPSLDLHGFAADPRSPQALYAAVAGQGLYRSRDGGRSFSQVSNDVGGNVMALAVMSDGRILAGDMERGLLESRDGGKSWKQTLRAQLMGLAVNPSDPNRLLASGAGIALSADGGRNWRQVLDLPAGAGPVAWSTSNPNIGYAVGLDRTLYRSSDKGESWQAVSKGG